MTKENTQGHIQLRPSQVQVSGKVIEQRISNVHYGNVSDNYVAYVAAFVWSAHLSRKASTYLVLIWSKREAGKAKLYKMHWLAENSASGDPRPRCRWSKPALLPMATTWSGGPPPRPPPSKRQDTWGIGG